MLRGTAAPRAGKLWIGRKRRGVKLLLQGALAGLTKGDAQMCTGGEGVGGGHTTLQRSKRTNKQLYLARSVLVSAARGGAQMVFPS